MVSGEEKQYGIGLRQIPVSRADVPSAAKLPSFTVIPPSWRRDLTREIDLVEEVARVHGYEAIPEDVGVPMVPSARRRDDRVFERGSASAVGRPDLMAGRTSLTLSEGMTGMMENVFLGVKNKSKTITAEVVVPAGGGNGAILVQGGRFGGWALYVKDGKPGYDYNFLGLQRFSVVSPRPLAPGKSTIELDFAYDGGGMGKGGTATLLVNGEKVAEGRIERTQAVIFSADETADVGIDLGTPVVEAVGCEERSRFTGRIPRVTLEVRDANAKSEAAAEEGQRTAQRRME